MSDESAIAYAERVKSDPAFRLSLAAAPDPAARLTIASEAGYDLSPADIPAIKAALGLDELSDADLEQVAGGLSGPDETHVKFTPIDTFGSTYFLAPLL